MLVAHTLPEASLRQLFSPLIRGVSGILTARQPLRYKLVYDGRGRVIGRVVAPENEDVFGVGRGTVYLTRD